MLSNITIRYLIVDVNNSTKYSIFNMKCIIAFQLRFTTLLRYTCPLLSQYGNLDNEKLPLPSVSQLFDLEFTKATKAPTKNTLFHLHFDQTYIPYQHLKIFHLLKEVLTVLLPYEPKSNPGGEISALYRYAIQTL